MKTIETLRNLANTDLTTYLETVNAMKANVKTLENIYGDHIEGTPAETVNAFVKAVGYDAAAAVIATLINRSAWDGRISRIRSAWAASIEDAFDEDAAVDQYIYTNRIHMAHLDQIGAAFMKYEPEPEPVEEAIEEAIEEAAAQAVAPEIELTASAFVREAIANVFGRMWAQIEAKNAETGKPICAYCVRSWKPSTPAGL